MSSDTLYSNKKLIFCSVTAALLLLSFPPFNIWPCAFIALVPLFFTLQKSSRTEAFFLSYFAGIIFLTGSIYWISEVSLFGCAFFITFYALFWGVFGLVGRELLKNSVIVRDQLFVSLVLAMIWTGLEVIRTSMPIFGVGWVLIGFSQTYNGGFIQIANILGAYGISFLVVLINALSYEAINSWQRNKKAFITDVILLAVLFTFIYAYGNLQLKRPPAGTRLRVATLQGNIPQDEKWNPQSKDLIIETYAKLVEFISYDGPQLVIMPEACYPGNFLYEFNAQSPLQNIIAEKETAVLLGAVRLESITKEHNSAFLISETGSVIDYYDKIELVPFGEYIPWKPFFSLIGLTKVAFSLGVGDFQPGKEFKVFRYTFPQKKEPISFSTLICFEDIFPYLSRAFVANGAQFLIVITNDAWFGRTTAAYQHMQASVFRAIENGCNVIRSANTGISTFISPHGKILDTVKDETGNELFVAGGITRDIFVSSTKTIYCRIGFMFEYFCLFVLAAAILLLYFPWAKLFNFKALRKNPPC